MIKEYKTATGDSHQQLDVSVNEFINDGFQPFGNPYAVVIMQDILRFCQAMVKSGEAVDRSDKGK